MRLPIAKFVTAVGVVAIGVALAATGIHIGETDDAPGAALLGIVLMIGSIALSVRIARRAGYLHGQQPVEERPVARQRDP